MAALDPQSVQLHRSGSGPPLVLLHCLGVDYRFWDFAVPLTSDFTLLRYDLPGHGSTPVPAESYRIEDLSDQLAAVLAQHGISRPHVAGISLGGLIAQHFAANAVVDRLVLIDTTPRYTEEMRAMWVERAAMRSEEHTSELQSPVHLVCRLLLEKKKKTQMLHGQKKKKIRKRLLKKDTNQK